MKALDHTHTHIRILQVFLDDLAQFFAICDSLRQIQGTQFYKYEHKTTSKRECFILKSFLRLQLK